MNAIYSVGHSNHPYAVFRDLLELAGVTAVVDVRSVPASRYNPWFNAAALRTALAADGIDYVPMGDALGGRPAAPSLMRDGIADYEAMARVPAFVAAVDRVIEGAVTRVQALMCSEGDPTECHRCLLVGRALHERGHAVRHLYKDGSFITQESVERRLLEWASPRRPGLFDPEPTLDAAYEARARKVAYATKGVTRPAGA